MAVETEEEFRAWLEEQPQEVCIAIACRANMRALPLATSTYYPHDDGSHALQSLRFVLTSAVAAALPLVLGKAFDFSKGDARFSDSFGSVGKNSVSGANVSAVLDIIERNALQFASFRQMKRISIDDTVRTASFADADLGRSDLMIAAIAVPVELGFVIANRLSDETPATRSNALRKVPKADAKWRFWLKWYEAAMRGEALSWDLQEQIALIPNGIWEAGPEAVADEIARIEAEFALRQRIEEAQADQFDVASNRHGIGGNNPPEQLDDEVASAQLIVIWDTIIGLKEEIDAEEPNAERVAALIDRLSAALKAVIAWHGRKGDLIVDTTIKWGIPAGGGSYFVVNPAKAEAVLKAAQAWLPFLLP